MSPETLGTAGAVVLGALGIVFRSKKAKERTAGERSTEFWSQEFERITERALKNALSARNEEIRRIVREELERYGR